MTDSRNCNSSGCAKRGPRRFPQTATRFIALAALWLPLPAGAGEQPQLEMHVKSTGDFEIDGSGKAAAWNKAAWTPLSRRGEAGHDYQARVKMLYSPTGLYVLFDGTDEKLTAKIQSDFENLWTEDVFEVFLWPDERFPVYFEYEISPLGYELPIIIPNFDGQFYGWRPWHYEEDRKTKKRVSVVEGEQKPGAAIRGWRAEVYFPYELLKPLKNVPPKPGMRWRANFYRMDYDHNTTTSWDWARVGPSFHEYQKFGTLLFE